MRNCNVVSLAPVLYERHDLRRQSSSNSDSESLQSILSFLVEGRTFKSWIEIITA